MMDIYIKKQQKKNEKIPAFIAVKYFYVTEHPVQKIS